MACTFLRRCLLPRMLCLTHSWVPSSLGAGARVGQGSGIMLFLSSPLCRSKGRSQAMLGSHPHTCEPLSKHDSLNTSTQTCTQARKDPLFSVRQTLMFSCSRRNYFCRFLSLLSDFSIGSVRCYYFKYYWCPVWCYFFFPQCFGSRPTFLRLQMPKTTRSACIQRLFFRSEISEAHSYFLWQGVFLRIYFPPPSS